MFSKDPSELVRKEKMDDEETARAIRLALVAELDAINFYLQQSRAMPDGPFKKVHEDISREEVTHFGEFMRLLYQYAPDDFKRIREGWSEASGLLGESADLGLDIKKQHEIHSESHEHSMKQEIHIKDMLDLPFAAVPWEQDGIALSEEPDRLYAIPYISYGFSVKKGSSDSILEMEREKATHSFKAMVLKSVVTEQELSLVSRSTRIPGLDWSKSGSIALGVTDAYRKLSENGYSTGTGVLIDPNGFRLLQREVSGTGQIEMDLVKTVTSDVRMLPYLPENSMVVYSSESLKILVRQDMEIREISQDLQNINFGISAKLAPLVYDRGSSIFIESKSRQ
ncbi:MAG: encapsulin [Thermoplasmataceae archaeon]